MTHMRTGIAIICVLALLPGCVPRGRPAAPAAPAATAPTSAAAAAETPPEPKKEDTFDKAGNIVSQPVRDVGIEKKKIPPILQQAQDAPYAPLAKSRGCGAIVSELAELNAVLGPDYDAPTTDKESKAGKLAEAGGSMIVNSLIPFRGVVREISGAAPADRRMAAAVDAGLARRGYLRGLAASRRCAIAR